jgi:hypothetical protein
VRVVFSLLAVAAIGWAARDIVVQWRQFRESGGHLTLHPWPILASGALVFAAYIVLIETWRSLVRATESTFTGAGAKHFTFGRAAHIWFVSNLGRYVPGKIWQISAMGVLAQRAGVSPAVAIGSSLIVNLVNLLVGFGVAVVTGAEFTGSQTAVSVAAFALLVALAALPLGIPWLARFVGRVTGRTLAVPSVPARSLWIAAVGCLIAWLAYGFAFQLLVAGVLGSAPGKATSYIAVFTGSYLLGYIALFSPGGIGVREGALSAMLRQVSLPVAGSAGIIALASRLWLTVLEVLPGLTLLLLNSLHSSRSSSSNASSSE